MVQDLAELGNDEGRDVQSVDGAEGSGIVRIAGIVAEEPNQFALDVADALDERILGRADHNHLADSRSTEPAPAEQSVAGSISRQHAVAIDPIQAPWPTDHLAALVWAKTSAISVIRSSSFWPSAGS